MNDSGILIFAHNNDKIDYFKLSILSGILAKKKLNLPISIITDSLTLKNVKNEKYYTEYIKEIDQIIEIDLIKKSNLRNYKFKNENNFLEFINSSRYYAYEFTPYQRTLMIDSDYLVLSDNLNSFLKLDSDFLIAKSYNDVMDESRIEYNNMYVSATGINLKWATTVIFSKNYKTKLLFDLVKYIHDNYYTYSRIYRFDSRMYRNDISFSIALHVLNGYINTSNYELPSVLSTLVTDSIFDVKDNKIFFLIDNNHQDNKLMSLYDQDIHVMNKLTLLDHFDNLIKL